MRLNSEQLQKMVQDSPALRRELERYYRRGFSQGVAAGAGAVGAGATAVDLEQWTQRVYEWRCNLTREPTAKDWTQWTRPEWPIGGAK